MNATASPSATASVRSWRSARPSGSRTPAARNSTKAGAATAAWLARAPEAVHGRRRSGRGAFGCAHGVDARQAHDDVDDAPGRAASPRACVAQAARHLVRPAVADDGRAARAPCRERNPRVRREILPADRVVVDHEPELRAVELGVNGGEMRLAAR